MSDNAEWQARQKLYQLDEGQHSSARILKGALCCMLCPVSGVGIRHVSLSVARQATKSYNFGSRLRSASTSAFSTRVVQAQRRQRADQCAFSSYRR